MFLGGYVIGKIKGVGPTKNIHGSGLEDWNI
jgi:hypothetical protein